MDEFLQSTACDFSESPAHERGGLSPCQKVGWAVATVLVQPNAVTASAATVNLVTPIPKPFQNDGAAWFGPNEYPGVKACPIPRADSYRLEASIFVNTPPTAFEPLPSKMVFRLKATRGTSPDLFAIGNLAESRCYREGDPLVESNTPFSGFGVSEGDWTFTFPWAPGVYSETRTLTSFESCYRFFELQILRASVMEEVWWNLIDSSANPIDGELQLPGDWGGTFTIYRIQRMIVRYTASRVTATTGTAIQFTDISATDNPKTNWLWNFGDGTTSTIQNPSKTYSAAGVYRVTLAITDTSLITYTSEPEIELTITIT